MRTQGGSKLFKVGHIRVDLREDEAEDKPSPNVNPV